MGTEKLPVVDDVGHGLAKEPTDSALLGGRFRDVCVPAPASQSVYKRDRDRDSDSDRDRDRDRDRERVIR